ncbi:MAG TPA: carboxyl transferase domain-containing protein, partial [Nannocystaceae bacterium]|nr:carboxyl transferase domain-containing protein [Nannocystaceae bacterium]
MVHVPLAPIGRARRSFCDDATFAAQLDAHAQRETLLRERRAEVARGWGDEYVARVHAKGKLTARERLALLADPGTPTFDVGTFVNYGLVFGKDLKSPGAGVVTSFARVHGRWCMVIANDN